MRGANRVQHVQKCPVHPSPGPHQISCMPADENRVIDPFAVTCVTIGREAHQLLQYFLRVSHPRTWHTEARAFPDRSYTFKSSAFSLVQGCIENEMNMYTMLASMASQLAYFEQIVEPPEPSLLIQKALLATQKHIRTCREVDERMIFDIHQLGVAEFYRFDVNAALVHLRAVKALIDQRGGLRFIDPSLMEWIVIGDGYVAAELLIKPLFPADDFDPGDVDRTLFQESTGKVVGTGSKLLALAHRGVMPVCLRQVLIDLIACAEHIHHQFSSKQVIPSDRLHWLHLRTTAIRHRLLALDLRDVRAHAIRLTLIIWVFMVMTITGRRRTMQVISSKLRDVLDAAGSHSWAEHEEIYRWVLVTGATASAERTTERAWFTTHILELRRSSRAPGSPSTSFEAGLLAEWISDFFFVEEVQGPMLHELVKQLNSTAT